MHDNDESTTVQVVVCENCQNQLDLHQPDLSTTQRLLGTCDACHAWFTVDIVPGKPVCMVQIDGRGPVMTTEF